MATKIRLQRGGRKARPIYSIVVADARAKRDGRFIEKLGTYNPNTNPATIDLNFDSALSWVMKGAQPTDTVVQFYLPWYNDEEALVGRCHKRCFD